MPFCPNCRYEYKAGIRECPDCGARLVEKLEEEESAKSIEEESAQRTDFVRLRSLPSRLYAEMLQESLKKEGIPSIIKGDDIGIMEGSYSTTSTVTVTIWIPEEDVERSEEIADQMLDHI